MYSYVLASASASQRAGRAEARRTLRPLTMGAGSSVADGIIGGSASRLCAAAREGNADKVRDLIQQSKSTGLDITWVRDENGNPPITLASKVGAVDVVRLLLQAGCSCLMPSRSGWTPLHAASERGDTAIIQMLLDTPEGSKGLAVDLDAPDDKGIVPLYAASFAGKAGAVECLALRKANVNLQRHDGSTALHVACKRGNTECIAALLRAGADASIEMEGCTTALYLACTYGQPECAKLILTSCPSIMDCVTQTGQTALFAASASRCVEAVRALLLAGAKINAAENGGCTPLHAACGEAAGALECVRVLLEHGADVNASSLKNETPHQLATRKHFLECAKLISSKPSSSMRASSD